MFKSNKIQRKARRLTSMLLVMMFVFTNIFSFNTTSYAQKNEILAVGQAETSSDIPPEETEQTTPPAEESKPTEEAKVTETPEPKEETKPTEAPKPTEEPAKAEEPTESETTESTEEELPEDDEVSLDELKEVTDYISDTEAENLESVIEFEDEQFINEIENEDGSVTVEYFTVPVKFKDENGEWVDIDANLESSPDPKYDYEAKETEVDIQISTDLSQSAAFQASYEKYSVGFKPVNMLKKSGKLAAKNKKRTKQGVEFGHTFDENIDMEVTAQDYGVKDHIILHKAPKQKEFSYEMAVENAVPKLAKDGRVYLIDPTSGKLFGIVERPFMFDSSPDENISFDIEVQIHEYSKGKYIYTLIPSKEYLKDKNTVYPVTIDPTVSLGANNSKYVADGSTDLTSPHLGVGKDTNGVRFRSYIQFTGLRTNLRDATVSEAILTLNQTHTGTTTITGEVKGMKDNSTALSSITWANQPDPLGTGTVAAVTKSVTGPGDYKWNLTNLVKYWLGQDLNTGLIRVRSEQESSNMWYKRFASTSHATTSSRPKLSVTYTASTADTSKPTNVSATPATWTSGNVKVTFSAPSPKPASGILKYQYATTATTTAPTAVTGTIENGQSLALPQDHRYVWVRTVAVSGATSNWVRAIYYRDATAPVIGTVTGPSPTVWIGNVPVVVSWTGAADAHSGIAAIQYQVNNGALKATGSTAASGSITIPAAELTVLNGTNTVAIVVTDKAGLTVKKSCTMIKDTTLPTLGTVTGPTDWIGNVPAVVSWTGAADAHSGIKSIEYQVNSGAWKTTGSIAANGSIAIPAAELTLNGTNEVAIKVTDNVNLAVQKSCTISKDTAPPKLDKITGPTDWIGNTAATVTWSGAVDDESGIASIQYQVNSGAWKDTGSTAASGSITIPATELTKNGADANTVLIRVTDNVELYIEKSCTIKKDIVAPVLGTVTGPTGWIGNVAAVVSWTGAGDAHSGVASIEYQVNGGEWKKAGSIAASGSITIPATDLTKNGTDANTVKIRVTDNVELYIEKSCTIKKDTTIPTLGTVTGPTGWIGNAAAVVSWTGAGDAHSGVASIQYQVNGGALKATGSTAASGSITIPAAELNINGTNEVTIWVTDNVTLQIKKSCSISKDTIAPAPAPVLVAGDAELMDGDSTKNQSKLSWTKSEDNLSGLKEYQIFLREDGKSYGSTPVGSVIGNASKLEFTLKNLEQGMTYYAKVRAVDTVGNYVDSNEKEIESPYMRHIVMFDSQGGTPDYPSIEVQKGNTIPEPNAPEKDGYEFGGWYKNADGTGAWDFEKDTVTSDMTLYASWIPTAAKVVRLDIDPADWTQDTTPSISWEIESTLPLTHVQYRIKQGTEVVVAWTEFNSTNNDDTESIKDCSALPDGEYTIEVRGVDDNNGERHGEAKSITYKKDTTSPVLDTVTGPTDWIGNTAAVVSWTGVDDVHSGVASIQYQVNDGVWKAAGSTATDGSVTIPAVELNVNGINEIKILVTDNVGLEIEKSCAISKDTIAPTPAPVLEADDAELMKEDLTKYQSKLSWTASTDNLSGLKEYQIFLREDGESYGSTPVGSVVGNASELEFTLENLEPDMTYYAKVRAVDIAGNYVDSIEKEIKTWPLQYTVTFDAQGGAPVPSLEDVNRGGTVPEPNAPEKDGYEFGGWYKNADGTGAWDFEKDTVTSDMTLYASWIPKAAKVVRLDIDPADWTQDTTPSISWEIESTLPLTHVQYQIKQGTEVVVAWTAFNSTNNDDTESIKDCSALPDGEYTIEVCGVDDYNGERHGEAKSVTYKKDTTPPEKPEPYVYEFRRSTVQGALDIEIRWKEVTDAASGVKEYMIDNPSGLSHTEPEKDSETDEWVVVFTQPLGEQKNIGINVTDHADNAIDTEIALYDGNLMSPELIAGIRASSEWSRDEGYGADKAIDGKLDTRWASEEPPSLEEQNGTVTFTVMFKDLQTFNHVLLNAWAKDGDTPAQRIASYEIQYLASEGGNWVTVAAGTEPPDRENVIHEFGTENGIGIRIVMEKVHPHLAVSLYEFQLRNLPTE